MTLKRKGRRTSGQKSKRFKSQAVIEITEVAKSERAASAEKESAKPERAALAEIIKSCSKKKKLPEAEHLHKLYVEDKDKSERNVVEDACKHIASRLEKIDGVIEARIGYREEDLVCHCVVDKDVKIPDEFEGYTIECNHISEFNKEDKAVLDKERQNSQLIPTVSEDLLKIINEKRDSLMKNHSNLIGISFSMHKSKLYEKRGKHTCDDKPCVVFNVKGKGVIPLYEEMLPSHLGSFDTDVRNSYFVRKVGGSPRDLHIDIKIGCKISTDTGSGTIGGFVEHKSVPMAITCAHVILDNDELGRLKKDPKKVPWGKRCYQPSKNGSNMIGTLHSATYNKYVDVAFVKLDPSRLPTQGVFPDVKDKTECSNPCNHCYGVF
ncbi:uncharacterized protein LOC123531136 [Mercenaria mercenaria]|uniref:uncharacterized protein LOC123531136 n=1 Tax=Mercenaria mercenaria TaxID=6596 RepID=UPI00234F70C1|nr:uncharacterized protein LOC123531136 [Mercenaria mercenaria]